MVQTDFDRLWDVAEPIERIALGLSARLNRNTPQSAVVEGPRLAGTRVLQTPGSTFDPSHYDATSCMLGQTL